MQAEFEARKNKNTAYSLRAYARDLGLDPGQLSLILSGKKNLSLPRSATIAKKLFDDSRRAQCFYHFAELHFAKDPNERTLLQEKIKKLETPTVHRDANIAEDELESISQWYGLPLLKLTDTKFPEITKDLAAAYFGLKENETFSMLERLRRLGFIKKVGPHYQKIKSLVTTTDIPSFGLKNFHSQMLKKAAQALFYQPIHKRYFSSVTVKLPPGALPEYKKIIEEAEDRLIELVNQHATDATLEVYHYSTQLISLRKEDYND